MQINNSQILFVLGITLCSALVAESLFGLGKTNLQKFESWLEQQKVSTYEDAYAKALQYAETKKASQVDDSWDTIRFVKFWKQLDESKKEGNCYDETLRAIKYAKDELEQNKLEGILSKYLNPLFKEVEEICSSKAHIYPKRRQIDPLTQANDLLLENTKSEDIFANIEAAKEILAKNQNDQVQQILSDFVALRPIVEQNRDGKLVCSDENMKLITAMESTMEKFTIGNWLTHMYYSAKDGDRLEQLVRATLVQFGTVCLEPLVGQFNSLEPKLDYDRVRALKQLSNYEDEEFYKPKMLVERARKETPINLSEEAAINWANRFVRMNIALNGNQQLCKWDPLEHTHYAPIELVQEKFDDIVVKTCKHFEREDLIPILEETLKIAKNVRLYPGTAPSAFVKNGLADVASNYVVCKRLEGIDQSKLVKNIAKNLPKAEKGLRKGKATSYLPRVPSESGC